MKNLVLVATERQKSFGVAWIRNDKISTEYPKPQILMKIDLLEFKKIDLLEFKKILKTIAKIVLRAKKFVNFPV